jgi:hypothetical protein
MAEPNPDAAEYQRRYYQENRDKKREYQRRYYQENRSEIRDRERQRYLANRERVLAEARQRYAADPAIRKRVRDYQAAHRPQIRDYLREYNRKRRSANPERAKEENRRINLRRRHGLSDAIWAAMWEAQQGRCYLCTRDMDPDDAHVEHWHGCGGGHDPENSCAACRRGLACQGCNHIIGLAGDDPDRLVLIATHLRAANADIAARQAVMPQHITLF